MSRSIIEIQTELNTVKQQLIDIDNLLIQVAKGGEKWSIRDGDAYREVWRSDLGSIVNTQSKLIARRKGLEEELAQAQGAVSGSSRVKIFRGC